MSYRSGVWLVDEPIDEPFPAVDEAGWSSRASKAMTKSRLKAIRGELAKLKSLQEDTGERENGLERAQCQRVNGSK